MPNLQFFFASRSNTTKSTCIMKSCKVVCFCKVSTLARIVAAISEVVATCAFSTTSWTFPSFYSSFICWLVACHFVILPPWEGMVGTITSTLKSSPSSSLGLVSWTKGHGRFMADVFMKFSCKLLHLGTSFNKGHQWIKHNPKFFRCLSLFFVKLLDSFKEITLP